MNEFTDFKTYKRYTNMYLIIFLSRFYLAN